MDTEGIAWRMISIAWLTLACSGTASPSPDSGTSLPQGARASSVTGGGQGGSTASDGGSSNAHSSSSSSGGAPNAGTANDGGTLSSSVSTGGAMTTSGGLPEGNQGIAAQYPGDVGIANDPGVIFADDFEAYTQAAQLSQRWTAVYQTQYVALTNDSANVYAGHQALEFTLPQQSAELSDATDKVISPEQDVLFLRYYSKFQPPYDVVGSSHNGSSISAHYFVNGQATPGVPADGKNKFLANLENWRGDSSTASPGLLNVYIYHPEQRSQWGDHFFPNGEVMPNTSVPFDFGLDFVSRPQVIPELDRWYCYELMLKANTPGQRDGRIALWLDGKLTGDFANLRLRDVASLRIDRFGLSFHIFSNPNGIAKKWYDNVVAASSYIGPVLSP